jgi:deoxyhypusine synthase
VYGDSSVYFPILCSYVMSACKRRKHKQIYDKKNSWVEEMKKIYFKNKRKNDQI